MARGISGGEVYLPLGPRTPGEYEVFLSTASSAAFYEWVEKSDPGMFEEIGARIAEGRWWIVGGGYLEWEELEG